MPLHDWTRVPSGLFHHFHQDWSIEIARTLNRGLLPQGVAALVEQRAGPHEADVLTIEATSHAGGPESQGRGGVVTLHPPLARIVRRTTKEIYTRRANRIVLRHHLGRIIAVIEIVSPGNKDGRAAFRHFVDKAVELLQGGIHVLVVDPFPPTARDPLGLHKAIWDEIDEEPFALPPGQDRTIVSYQAGDDLTAYVEPVGVGQELPDMPLFLRRGYHVLVPLETTYRAAWDASPHEMRVAVESGLMPEPDPE